MREDPIEMGFGPTQEDIEESIERAERKRAQDEWAMGHGFLEKARHGIGNEDRTYEEHLADSRNLLMAVEQLYWMLKPRGYGERP